MPSPPAQGASSLSGHPAAMRRNYFWGLSKLRQCPRGKSVVPSSSPADFQLGESDTALLTEVGMVLSTPSPISCSLPGCARAPGPCPSPRRGAHHLTVMFTAWLSFSLLSKEDVFVVPCSEGTTIKPSLLFGGVGTPF